MAKNEAQLHKLAIEARRILKARGVNSLLADATANPKVAKNIGIGVLTAPLHLAPASLSGYNVCPMATAGCRAACLHTAGNPVYMAAKANARDKRTKAYFEARDAFMIALASEIARVRDKARRMGLKCGIRLNATSDIPWERVPVTVGKLTYANLMVMFPTVQFYDYTKRHNRTNLPRNYSLTYSLAENNDAQALAAIANGMNVAAVFTTRRHKPLPQGYAINGIIWPVIDGDEHDYRPADPRQVIVGLRAKGAAIGDASGFVRPV